MKEYFLNLKTLSGELAKRLPPNSFYKENSEYLDQAVRLIDHDPCLVFLSNHLKKRLIDDFGHGWTHARRVAMDAATIIFREHSSAGNDIKIMASLAMYAGLLHDLYRGRTNHAQKAARAAIKILSRIGIPEERSKWVAYAISNHEAFKALLKSNQQESIIISNALYDADKFQWGEVNFTNTIWSILNFNEVDIDDLQAKFKSGLKIIQRIKSTFRTETGKKYGPPLIDRGLWIGKEILKHFN